MSFSFYEFLAATPSPDVDPASTFYSPGVIGFIATFGVTAGAVFIIFDMVRRVRRVRYRAEIQEKLAAETRAGATEEAPGSRLNTDAMSSKPRANKKPARPAPPAKPSRD